MATSGTSCSSLVSRTSVSLMNRGAVIVTAVGLMVGQFLLRFVWSDASLVSSLFGALLAGVILLAVLWAINRGKRTGVDN